MTANPSLDFQTTLTRWQTQVEHGLDARLPPAASPPTTLHEAMRYSVLDGGKRIRPALAFATAAAVGLPDTAVMGAACAVEMIHAYSLIHDDLPAMDDDDLRRGKPTCHRKFDQATAILAGDALQVLAFEVLAADPTLPADPAIRLRLVELLAKASGTAGMAGGQALDLAAAGQTLALTDVVEMHSRKTGALISAGILMAAACAPNLKPELHGALQRYAACIGLAFQIQDDLLDIEGDPKLLGKATGADRAHQKPTYPAVAGVDAAREKMCALHAEALRAIESFGEQGTLLAQISNWLVLRKH